MTGAAAVTKTTGSTTCTTAPASCRPAARVQHCSAARLAAASSRPLRQRPRPDRRLTPRSEFDHAQRELCRPTDPPVQPSAAAELRHLCRSADLHRNQSRTAWVRR